MTRNNGWSVTAPRARAAHGVAVPKQLVWFMVGASMAASAGCAAVVTQRVETVIDEALPDLIGPAARYETRVDGVSDAASRFERIRVVGSRVARAGVPVLDRVEGDLRNVVVDRADKRIVGIGSAAVTAELQAADLAAWLASRGLVDGAEVVFEPPAGVVARGRLKLPGTALASAAPAEFRGTLSARGSRLHLSVDALALGTAAAPALLRGLLENALDPVVDVAAYAVPSRIDSVQVEGSRLRIVGGGVDLTPARGARLLR